MMQSKLMPWYLAHARKTLCQPLLTAYAAIGTYWDTIAKHIK